MCGESNEHMEREQDIYRLAQGAVECFIHSYQLQELNGWKLRRSSDMENMKQTHSKRINQHVIHADKIPKPREHTIHVWL
jgi:hypothetical protein